MPFGSRVDHDSSPLPDVTEQASIAHACALRVDSATLRAIQAVLETQHVGNLSPNAQVASPPSRASRSGREWGYGGWRRVTTAVRHQ